MPKKPKIDEFRQEDFMKMDSLHYLSSEVGLRILAFFETAEGDYVTYLKPSIDPNMPQVKECRDEIDYNYKFDAWIKKCTVKSPYYHTFHEMVLGEIERLNVLLSELSG